MIRIFVVITFVCMVSGNGDMTEVEKYLARFNERSPPTPPIDDLMYRHEEDSSKDFTSMAL